MTTTIRLPFINDVRLSGRLTRDPELRLTAKGQSVCRLGLAVNRRFKDAAGEWRDETAFVSVTVWREAAQRCGERLKKGSPVYVEGRLTSREWEAKDGQKRNSLEVLAAKIQFLEKSGDGKGGTSGHGPEGDAMEPAAEKVSAEEPSGSADDEEIPF